MLFVSPLPILLAFGVESIVGVWRGLGPSAADHELIIMRKSIVVIGASALCGAVMVVFPSLILKLFTVLAALALAFVLTRFIPANQAVSILIATVLILTVINGAFGSLYPLLLDPRNLHGRW
jgi:cytochrome bd-type quinol oxidase subunit 2